jgi:hypothetical protein
MLRIERTAGLAVLTGILSVLAGGFWHQQASEAAVTTIAVSLIVGLIGFTARKFAEKRAA